MLGLGSIFYVSLLLINAMAILNEERFLAISMSSADTCEGQALMGLPLVGWTSKSTQSAQQNVYHQPYDPYSGIGMNGPGQDIGVKAKLINLIGAVRTLMRGTFQYYSTNPCISHSSMICSTINIH